MLQSASRGVHLVLCTLPAKKLFTESMANVWWDILECQGSSKFSPVQSKGGHRLRRAGRRLYLIRKHGGGPQDRLYCYKCNKAPRHAFAECFRQVEEGNKTPSFISKSLSGTFSCKRQRNNTVTAGTNVLKEQRQHVRGVENVFQILFRNSGLL